MSNIEPDDLRRISIPIYEDAIKNLQEIRILMDENPPKAKQKLTNLINIYWNQLKGCYEL